MATHSNLKNYNRFRLVSKSLSSINENDELRRADFPFSKEILRRKYPVRALRYWWMSCVIEDEIKNAAKAVTIADVGCDRGIIKRFIPPVKDAHWIGLDIQTDKSGIELAKYDELRQCDFDEEIPLDDASVDIAICSHVLEHLPRPDFSLGEIVRVMRPGAMLLLGVPIAPRFIANLRERQFAKELKSGKRQTGQHIQMFSIKRLRRLVEESGLEIEFSVGTALIRKNGSILENYAAWIRFNQIWAALFPSLGMELCLQLRKPR